MPIGGYHQRVLLVDVSTGAYREEPLSEEELRSCLGGVGLGTYLLLKYGEPAASAFDARSAVVLAFSPLVGSPLTTSARFALVSKSPLTDRLNDSLCGSRFAIQGKRLGFDAIVLVGQAPQPSVLRVTQTDGSDGGKLEVDLHSATDVWGCEVSATEQLLRQQYGGEDASLVIGPAGENRVRYATAAHDGRHAGRGGTGAVLGAKRIKAIMVRGERIAPAAHPRLLRDLAREWAARSQGPATAKYRELGTVANAEVLNRLHALPTRNFQRGQTATPIVLANTNVPTTGSQQVRSGCAACTIRCEHYFKTDSSATNATSVRMEYESLFALGPLCDIVDPEAIGRAVARCDELGLDTISAGGTIAFALECAERGWLQETLPRFGEAESIVKLLEQIAHRQGIGDLLAEGSRLAAAAIGHGSEQIAPHVKGLEIPGYEPRALQTMALGFAVGSRGADHNRSGAYEVDFSPGVNRRRLALESVPLAIRKEDEAAIFDSLILCKFLRGIFRDPFTDAAQALRTLVGWEITAEELQETACRIANLKKIFNVRAGWTSTEDTLPQRFFDTPLEDDPSAILDESVLRAAVSAYYAQRGWDRHGVPQQHVLIGAQNWGSDHDFRIAD